MIERVQCFKGDERGERDQPLTGLYIMHFVLFLRKLLAMLAKAQGSVGQWVHCFAPDRDISTTVEYVTKLLCTHILALLSTLMTPESLHGLSSDSS